MPGMSLHCVAGLHRPLAMCSMAGKWWYQLAVSKVSPMWTVCLTMPSAEQCACTDMSTTEATASRSAWGAGMR